MEATERIVFLDTETTGLDPRLGHRIIEVAGVEAIGRRTTGKSIHFYIDPEREIDAGANISVASQLFDCLEQLRH